MNAKVNIHSVINENEYGMIDVEWTETVTAKTMAAAKASATKFINRSGFNYDIENGLLRLEKHGSEWYLI